MTSQILTSGHLYRRNGLLSTAFNSTKSEVIAIQHHRRYRKALCSPSQTYKHPIDIIKDKSMSTHQKLQILLSWRSEAFLLQAAENEGFKGGECCLADAIETCLKQLTF